MGGGLKGHAGQGKQGIARGGRGGGGGLKGHAGQGKQGIGVG